MKVANKVDMNNAPLVNAMGLSDATGKPIASGGGTPTFTTQDAAINGLLVTTDRLTDINTDGQITLNSNQPYFHQVVAPYGVTVGGLVVWIKFTGYQDTTNYRNAVGLFDTNGNRLAVANASATFRDLQGWQRIAFENSVNLIAGTKYVVGLIIDGNSPGFARCNGFSEINTYIPSGSLPRTFRKNSVPNFAGNMDFTTGLSPNTSDRIFMALVA